MSDVYELEDLDTVRTTRTRVSAHKETRKQLIEQRVQLNADLARVNAELKVNETKLLLLGEKIISL